jgi:hypothetical protein
MEGFVILPQRVGRDAKVCKIGKVMWVKATDLLIGEEDWRSNK